MAGPNAPYTHLDADQTLTQSFSEAEDALRVIGISGTIVPEIYDAIYLTYVAAGNGAGEIETVTYEYQSGTVAVLTLSYNSDNKLISVVKS